MIVIPPAVIEPIVEVARMVLPEVTNLIAMALPPILPPFAVTNAAGKVLNAIAKVPAREIIARSPGATDVAGPIADSPPASDITASDAATADITTANVSTADTPAADVTASTTRSSRTSEIGTPL
jgi:hypothetical protein